MFVTSAVRAVRNKMKMAIIVSGLRSTALAQASGLAYLNGCESRGLHVARLALFAYSVKTPLSFLQSGSAALENVILKYGRGQARAHSLFL